MAEKTLTVKGLKKEQSELRAAYKKADAEYHKALDNHKAAKSKLVDFNNSYGRVLEILDSDAQE